MSGPSARESVAVLTGWLSRMGNPGSEKTTTFALRGEAEDRAIRIPRQRVRISLLIEISLPAEDVMKVVDMTQFCKTMRI
jgi:hypothetical protein